ncbi:MAG: sugar phosphate isomerase/epimerase [Alphaproteobacteria bacterium]|nr:sugar phosphate isomerase/epimerase [Alphaproteobacteria bacterium]
MNPHSFSFNSANMTGLTADRLTAIEEAGFASATLWPADLFVHFEDPEAIIALIRSSAVAVSAYQCVRDLEGSPAIVRGRKMELARQFIDQMKLIGCDMLVLCSNVGDNVDRNWAQAVADLQAIGELGRANSVRIAFEPICYGSWINTYVKGWELVRDADHSHVGLVLDAAHIFLPESPLEPIEQIPGHKIFLVELSDFPTASLDKRELLRNYRMFPGEGVRPLRAFVDRVEATGYAGPISLEVFNARYRASDARFVARRGMQALEALFGSNPAG